MRVDKFKTETIVTADRGNYLKFKDESITEDIIGKPERIIFSNKALIPEMIEAPIEDVEVIADTTTKKKATRKKSSK